jgi:integrase
MPADLTTRTIKTLGRGLHRAAPNLYLSVQSGDSKNGRSWVFLYTSPSTGKRREMGLGPADIITLARAKELTLRHRLALTEGRDPIDEKRARRPVRENLLTFRQVADLYVGAHEASWRSSKHRAQWVSTLEAYAYPVLADLAVRDIDIGAVMRVLEEIWREKPETASRVSGRIEVVLDYAKARHWRQGDNPARWKGHVENLLPKRHALKPTVHRAAVPWKELPALWAKLASREDVPALALRLVVLTATRSEETRGASWSEFDLNAKVWTIPASRMKGGREHRIPLTPAMCEVLDRLEAVRQGDYVFPGAKIGRPIGVNAMVLALHSLRPDVTVHGFRSSFRDWASEHGINGEVAEACLAHVVGNRVEAAYRRGDLLEPRRVVMERWASYLTAPAAEPAVVPMRGRATG